MLLNDLLAVRVVAPLGNCGCHSSTPRLKPGTRPPQGEKRAQKEIAAARCHRCGSRNAPDYANTPFESSRNRIGLVSYVLVVAYWLCGVSIKEAATSTKLFVRTVGNIYRRCRKFVAWFESNRRRHTDLDIMVDLTWGPHRRAVHVGAPARPRVLDSFPVQVVIAYETVDRDGTPARQMIRDSVRVQSVESKRARYNVAVLQTMANPTCRVSSDQGGEFAELPNVFASARTVNHSIEWVSSDGTTTNMVEMTNGLLKAEARKRIFSKVTCRRRSSAKSGTNWPGLSTMSFTYRALLPADACWHSWIVFGNIV